MNRRRPTAQGLRHVYLRHVYLTLAMLAVALKVLIPAGFMAAPAKASELPFAIVLCTSEGMVTVDAGKALPGDHDHDHDQGHAADQDDHDGPCAFAGHGLGAPAPGAIDLGAAHSVAYDLRRPEIRVGLAPGRGLAGPPLPARGPPVELI